ncbi:protein phosphatase methylesterase 1 [Culicoides brevitarsis]|uniref:protein phosphatase methylesterase 1 n=1 Tax=Culicoides brevitarsis TaxID=469753 RepID=UPI00307C9682
MSNLQKNMLKSRLPPLPPKLESNLRKGVTSRQKDYNPTQWNQYFEESRDVVTPRGTFRCYLSKKPQNPGPVVVCLHGGGYSALSWSHFSIEITEMVHCTCLAIDLRGHGDTQTDDDSDLSAETMSQDVAGVLKSLYGDEMPQIIMIGHSMGGAICVHVAEMEELSTLVGVVVIDVVEGTAMEALASMQSFLRSRPSHFKSIQHAIEWSIRSGQIRNVQSAKVSMPGQIVNVATGKLATNELPLDASRQSSVDVPEEKSSFSSPMAIPEDAEFVPEESAARPFTAPVLEDPKKYKWRIDLSKSEKYWPGWFEGLSNKFLNLRPAKLLLLAGIDNLDKTLTVGQMQGKFQMQVLARCGHAVHEDLPHDVAEVVGSFMLRNRFSTEAGEFIRRMPAC